LEVKIGNKIIGQNNPCLISLEPSATYENLDEAIAMIKAISNSGADAVKFQTFLPGDAEKIMGNKDITVNFSTETGTKKELVFDALKRRELSKNEWKELVEYAKKENLLFITASYFNETIDFLEGVGIDAFKVSKGDINNVLLIEKMAKTKIPIILDGREKFRDVDIAIKICEENDNHNIIIMHCPSGYPAKYDGIHLNAIKTIQEKYKYPVAFADHSPGDIMNYAAISLGSSMLEKTITMNKKIEKVEHFMSLEIKEIKNFVENIRNLEKSMGDPNILNISRVEETARRSLIAKISIKKDTKITKNMLDYRRPGDEGISCADGFKILDKISKVNIPKGKFLDWSMFEN